MILIAANVLCQMTHNSGHLPVIWANPRLWHVNCGQAHENGCYGRESANNENAAGDSRLCRSHPTAPTASAARAIPHPIALARNAYHYSPKETDHRRRYARSAGYPAPREDHSFERDSTPQCGSRGPSYSARFALRIAGLPYPPLRRLFSLLQVQGLSRFLLP